MSAVEVFYGTWKITDCANLCASNNVIPAAIQGVIFVLQDNGEVVWELSPEVDETFPLFQCDCYEVIHTFVGVCIQMGAVSGHIFEFWVDRPVPRDVMLLTFEGWCMIQCQQIMPTQQPLDFSYSFLTAFNEGYFTDVQIPRSCSNNGTVFKVHSVVLELCNVNPADIAELPSDVLRVLLYFVYTQSLPLSLSGELARKSALLAPPAMTDFTKLCQDYLHRTVIKQKIIQLVNEVHAYAEGMAVAFKDRTIVAPPRLCYVMKATLRDACVAFMKLVELCVLYGEEAPLLSRDERLEILRFAKTRLPLFLTQFVTMLKNIKADFSVVKQTDRNDIAAHVAPELESLVNGMCDLMREAKDACNEIWIRWSANAGSPGEVPYPPFLQRWSEDFSHPLPTEDTPPVELKDALHMIFRRREIVKLHHVQAQVAAMYLYLIQKKENFDEMATAVKVRCVARNLEQLLEELPVFLLRLEEIMIAFDDRFQWKDFKFCLQLAISQVYQTIQHLRNEKQQLQKFFNCCIELIQRDEFHHSLVNLGLLEVPSDSSVSPKASPDSGISTSSSTSSSNSTGFPLDALPSAQSDRFSKETSSIEFKFTESMGQPENDKLSLVDRLCSPMLAKESILSKNAAKILETKEHADMVFEIAQQDEETVEIPAHRVIVAARCDHFRRALLSGMKESIQKRIVIHDCSAYVFRLFLDFVYTGAITSEVTLETLSELIALADRYELDMLKLYCEQELAVRHLDEASAIFLLSMADQYNARTLRGATMEYIAAHPGIMGKDTFEELSPELQMEVYDITMWSKPKKVFSIPDELLSCPRYMLVPDSPSEDENSSGSSSPTLGRRHSHRHHHTHTHSHTHHTHSSHGSTTGSSNLLPSHQNPFTDTNTTSFSVQQAIANSIAERRSRGFAGGMESSERSSSSANREYQDNQVNENNANESKCAGPPFVLGSSKEAQTASNTRDGEEEGFGNNPSELGNDGSNMEICLSQLRDVLGNDVPQEDLHRLAIASDCVVDEALNLYFSSI